MDELKPCPFCGGKAQLVKLSAVSYVRCVYFCCEQALTFTDDDEAIEAWNRRAEKEELEFTRKFIHDNGLEFALMSAWNRRANNE